MANYQFTAAPVVDADVEKRVLIVTVNGVADANREYPPATVDFGIIQILENAQVTATLVDVDKTGNTSLPETITFDSIDTLPPAKPTGLKAVQVP